MKHCRDCRYYEKVDKDMKQGICRKFPPSVFPFPVQGKVSLNPGMPNMVGMQLQSFFPPVMDDCWCGKWSINGEAGKEATS